MYLAGMQKPDFHTICLFRSKHAEDIKQIFIEAVRLCASLGMVGLGHIAFDGTKLKANASVRQTREKESLNKEIAKITAEIDGLLTRAKEVDEREDLLYGKDSNGSGIPEEIRDKKYRLKKLKEASKQLAEEELNKVNITDPGAHLMQDSKKVIQPSLQWPDCRRFPGADYCCQRPNTGSNRPLSIKAYDSTGRAKS